QSLAFFVIRAKTNMDYHVHSRRTVDKSTGLRTDQTIILNGIKTAGYYPAPLRRISFFDTDTNKRLVFLTNNFTLPPLTIASLYKCRWQVELFFKWIKQHLRIKTFYGTSMNAVKTQIWIAITTYVLVAIVKKQLNINRSLSEILQILSISLFERTHMVQLLTTSDTQNETDQTRNQLSLLNF
ncbi:MAG: IS4 family transposase, partial [Candidatus Eisenbacteria bacterium]|nr:IS4 family transposase [Candidatus Eisenbacteria bacterium]